MEDIRKSNGWDWTDKSKVYRVGIHEEIFLNIDFGINSQRQDCKRVQGGYL
jgi:hypothetical protein